MPQADTQWPGVGMKRGADRLAETPSEVLIQPADQQHSLGGKKKHKKKKAQKNSLKP